MREKGMTLFPILSLLAALCGAQEASLNTDFHFYGDDTEFRGPYRDGDTLFGVHLAAVLDLKWAEGFSAHAGIWAGRRNGSDEFFDESRPVLSALFSHGGTSFILGSFFPEKRHGFLEPLQDPRFEFTRPLENGFQWTDEGRGHRFQMFLNWQRYATPARREIFDSGLLARRDLSRSMAAEVQVHSWHRGGQVAATGTVINNNAAAIGFVFAPGNVWGLRLSLHVLGSKTTLEPEFPLRKTMGHGILGRLEARPWARVGLYALYWDARDFTSFEGDPNYNSQGMDAGTYERKRTYAEAGITYEWQMVSAAFLEGQLALHVVDNDEVTPSLRFSLRIPVEVPLGRIPSAPKDTGAATE